MNLDAYKAGSTEPWTVDVVLALMKAKRPARTLELGTFEGLTTAQLALTARAWNGHVTTVEYDPARVAIARAHCASLGLANITFVTADAISFLDGTPNGAFDFAFVDDDHDAMHVSRELERLWSWTDTKSRKVSAGALICMHDVDGPFGLGGVCIAHRGYVLNLPRLHAAGGLGLIQV